jgi:protein-S-isoprenylcysteine O-methyltransferase Ste14
VRIDTDLRSVMFRYRSYTPIPFLVAMVIFARPTAASLLIGFVILALGEALRFWGVSIAGSETRTTGSVGGTYLIVTGPFAYVRNPLYLGNLLLYAGVGVMSMALFPWLLAAALGWFYFQYYQIVTREEEYLAQTFGDAYQRYRGSVRRFLPRLSSYRTSEPAPKSLSFAEGFRSERRTLQAIALVLAVILAVFFVRR